MLSVIGDSWGEVPPWAAGSPYRPAVNFLYMGLFLTLRKIGYPKLTYPARANGEAGGWLSRAAAVRKMR
jgi:hypothetical protein